MQKNELVKQLNKGLIVSCQALESEPLYSESGGIMPKMARAAKIGGAVGIRANTVRDISEIQNENLGLPIIGIIKRDYEGSTAYITPSMKEIDELAAINVDIIAFDGTKNTRKEGGDAPEFIKKIKKKYPNQLLMADIATYDEAVACIEAGVDFVGTTLSGYVPWSEKSDGPNFELVKKIVENHDTPVIAEGKIHTPEDALKMLEIGAHCVVVGGAITRPAEITGRFVSKINEYREK